MKALKLLSLKIRVKNHLLANLCLMAIASCSALAGDNLGHKDDSKVVGAISALEKKDLETAYKTLETVSMDSLSFRMAFLEMQKIHYRTASWDQFFGYAHFYRKKLLTQFFQPELIALEALALTKHWQFDSASQVVLMGKEVSRSLKEGEKSSYPAVVNLYKRELKRRGGSKEDLSKSLARFEADLTAVENLLLLQSQMPGRVKTRPVAQKARVFSKDLFWNIQQDDVRQKVVERAVMSPKALRVYVANVCGSET